jgi:uncharacterized membrane protein
MPTASRSTWLIPAGLIALAAVPAFAGALRLSELAGGAAVLPDGDRIGSAPVPVVAHIVAVTVYAVLGAFQFSPGLRRRRIGWHRAAGRLLVPCGLVVALSGLWLTLFLPRTATDSDLLAGVRVAVGLFMIGSIGLGVAAVLRRDIGRHRAWMIRAYAIAMGAGTQAFTQAPWVLLVGPVDQRSRAALMTGAWLVNVAVAEWIIRRPARSPSRPGRPDTGDLGRLLSRRRWQTSKIAEKTAAGDR